MALRRTSATAKRGTKDPDPVVADAAFTESLAHRIRRCHQIAVALFFEEFAPFDVTPMQWVALTAIAVHRDLDATRLSQIVAFDKSTLGNVLERLETKGWITRESRADDKRSKRLLLTAAGKKLLRDAAPAAARARARYVDVLTPQEQTELRRLLGKIIDLHAADEARFEQTTRRPDG